MPQAPLLTLNDGVRIPQLGLGVWQLDDDQAYVSGKAAFEAGYRHIDTAMMYKNEAGVGRAVADSGLSRDEIFITTKLWNADQGYDSTLRAFDESMKRLGLEKLDLYLIHWALPKKDAYVDTWKAFVRLKEEGRIRSIGVSNFNADHLERVIAETGVTPSVNQIELHPDFPQNELVTFCRDKKIAIESWSPLGQGGKLLDEPTLKQIAAKYDKTTAQVIIRWHLQQGHIVIPRSKSPERIAANIDVFDFELDKLDLKGIAEIPDGGRLGPNPATMDTGA